MKLAIWSSCCSGVRIGFPASTSSDRPTPLLPAEEPAEPKVPADAETEAEVGDEADAEDPEVGLLAMGLFYIPG